MKRSSIQTWALAFAAFYDFFIHRNPDIQKPVLQYSVKRAHPWDMLIHHEWSKRPSWQGIRVLTSHLTKTVEVLCTTVFLIYSSSTTVFLIYSISTNGGLSELSVSYLPWYNQGCCNVTNDISYFVHSIVFT